MVVAGAHHEHECGVHAVLGNDLARLLIVKRKHGIEVADSADDALALESVRAHLADVRRVTDGTDGHAAHELAGKCGDQVEVVAEHGIGAELRHRALDGGGERPLEGSGHRRREVTVARRGVRHHVGHAADGKRELGRLKVHRVHRNAIGQLLLRVTGGRAAEHRRLMTCGELSPHKGGEIRAAPRAIGFLGRDVENAHPGSLRQRLRPHGGTDGAGIASGRRCRDRRAQQCAQTLHNIGVFA